MSCIGGFETLNLRDCILRIDSAGSRARVEGLFQLKWRGAVPELETRGYAVRLITTILSGVRYKNLHPKNRIASKRMNQPCKKYLKFDSLRKIFGFQKKFEVGE